MSKAKRKEVAAKTAKTQKRRGEPVALTTPDFLAEQKEQLRQAFPHVFTEGKIDWEKLQTALGDSVDERPERYSFTWAGKRQAIQELQKPTWGTLVPVKSESVNFDTTQNVFIEGENLEVLKLLYKSYFGRVKMIIIDPPYNTGGDFVYPDNFADPEDAYLRITGQKDTEGNLLTSNPESSGRYHSAWLSMMYPRLFLARQLLREDGVIFVCINDVEVAHTRLLLDEIFGNDTFIGSFIWKSRHNVDSRDKSGVSSDHEYVLCYGRSIQGKPKDMDKYSNPDNDPRGPWMSDNMVGLATKDKRPNLHYDLINPKTGINYGCPEKGWRYEPATMQKKISEKRILWPSKPDGRPRHKKFAKELESDFTGFSTLLDVPNTSAGTQEVRELMGAEVFDFPKPAGLLKALIRQAAKDGDIILDFFSGSATTAHASFEVNREDGGSRQFILVQLPEPTLDGSAPRKRGFKTIADIGKERIRRVISKMSKKREGELPLKHDTSSEDLGFAVFNLKTSSFKAWVNKSTSTAETLATAMELFNDPLVDGWKPENVIYEVAIKEGFSLTLRIEKLAKVKANKVFLVTDAEKEQSFHICLDDELKAATLKELSLKKDDLFICRDVALNDKAAANLALQCRLKTI